MPNDQKPVNVKILRDLLLCGANDRQGARLTVYEAAYLNQLFDMLSVQAPHQFERITRTLDDLDAERRADVEALVRRDARQERD
jgi:hypothetical protein